MRLLRAMVAPRCGCAWSSVLLHPGVSVPLRCIRKILLRPVDPFGFFVVERQNREQPVMGQLILLNSCLELPTHHLAPQVFSKACGAIGDPGIKSAVVQVLWVVLLTLPPFCMKMAVPLSCSHCTWSCNF